MAKLVVLGLGFALIVWANLQQPGDAVATGTAQVETSKPPRRELVGTTSCATSVCHGGAELGSRGSEATAWQAFDPHARAFDTLLSATSRRIAAHLKLKGPAHEEPSCLKCHVDPGYTTARPNFRREAGVSCESCHGPAQDWLAPHYRAAWKTADKQAHGMTDTMSLPGRAAVCVGCHVGAADREVNHDLIAAGHPALRFEFATYFANLPPHWDVSRTKAGALEVWAVGQMVTSAGALDLLAHRADPASARPWPEFAELDCFACHHDLNSKSWRTSEAHLGKRRPGSLTINAWHHAMIPDVLSLAKSPRAQEALKSFTAKHEPAYDLAGRQKLASAARQLAGELRALVHLPLATDRLSLLDSAYRNWDEAAQRYLALLALAQDRKDRKLPPDPNLDRNIERLQKEVRLPGVYGP
jgi:hypothetical protein